MSLRSLDQEIALWENYLLCLWPQYQSAVLSPVSSQERRELRAHYRDRKVRLDRLRDLRSNRARNIAKADRERAKRKAAWAGRLLGEKIAASEARKRAQVRHQLDVTRYGDDERRLVDYYADRYRTTIEWSPLHGDGTLRGVPNGETSNASHYPK